MRQPLRQCGITPKTTYTMLFEFGDIILVPFPLTSQAASKKRPAIVVSTANYNRNRPDVVLMAITSQLRVPAGELDLLVEQWLAVDDGGRKAPWRRFPRLANLFGEQGLFVLRRG